jgi:hypothetical protein
VYTLEAAIKKANIMKAALAASKLRAYQATFTPSPNSLLADFVAAECDYSGYTAGGETITAFGAPYLDPSGGATIAAPSIQFQGAAATPFVTNGIGGFWIETSTGALVTYWPLPAPINITSPDSGVPFVASFNEGANPVL